jgi:HAD superfamily hydrolase (TIGR01509 family)
MPEAVIFDIDGTLVDSVQFHAEAWVAAFQQFGYTVSVDQMQQQIGKGGEFIIDEVLSPEAAERDGEKIHQYRRQYFHEHFLPKIQPFPQVRALFQQLRADGLQIVLASSAQPESAEHYIDLVNVKDLIQGVTTTGDVENAKPSPDVFQAALEKLSGVSASRVVVVGDSPYDAEAARKISLSTIGLLSGGFSPEQLQSAGCIAIYEDPADLLAHYAESPLKPRNPSTAP